MKKTLLLLTVSGLLGSLHAQTPVTVSTHPANADQVWYSLLNGEVGRAPLADWDLAFEMTGLTAGVRVNTAKGTVVYETPYTFAQWDQLTAPDEAAWTRVDNEVTRWDFGALNHGNDMDAPDGYNVGWGVYNPANHHMNGDKVYALAMPDGSWKKLRMNSVINGTFSFTYANLDGTGAQDASLNKAQYAGRNFAYWSFTSNAALNMEPANATWDLLFTKYTDFVPTPYNVAGVLQNRNVTALQVNGVPTADAQWTDGPFSTDINVIGSDWKRYSGGGYAIAPDTTYFVKDVPGNIWKIIFTGYGGGATGDMSFTQELMSAAGVQETGVAQGTLLIAPNPATAGPVQVLVDVPGGQGVLRVTNAAGQQVATAQWSGIHGLAVRTLDAGSLPAGLYMLRFETPVAVATAKLLVQ